MTIAPDKRGHCVAGFGIAAVTTSASFMFSHNPWLACLVGVSSAAIVGALKELSDWILNQRAKSKGLPPPHGVEFLDFVATTVGGILFDGFLACMILLARWIVSLLLMASVLVLGGCAAAYIPKLPKLPDVVEQHDAADAKKRDDIIVNGSLAERAKALQETRDELRDKLDQTERRIKQNDRDMQAADIKSRQHWCYGIAGFLLLIAVAAFALSFVPWIPTTPARWLAGIAASLACGVIALGAVMPYIIYIACVGFFGAVGVVLYQFASPRLKALHELANVNGIPSLHLSDKARKGLNAARDVVETAALAAVKKAERAAAKVVNATPTDVFPKIKSSVVPPSRTTNEPPP